MNFTHHDFSYVQNTCYKYTGSGIFRQKEYAAAAGFPLAALHPMFSQIPAWLGSSGTLPGAVIGSNPAAANPAATNPAAVPGVWGRTKDLAMAHGKCKIPGTLQGPGSHSPGATWRSLHAQRLLPECWVFHHLCYVLH